MMICAYNRVFHDEQENGEQLIEVCDDIPLGEENGWEEAHENEGDGGGDEKTWNYNHAC